MSLSNDERVQLRDFLITRFTISEIKSLTFNMGIPYENIPHSSRPELAEELILYCERLHQVGCLLEQVIRQRPDSKVTEMLSHEPPCNPRVKIYIVIDGVEKFPGSQDELKNIVADYAHVFVDDISLIASRRASVEFLLATPNTILTFDQVEFRSVVTKHKLELPQIAIGYFSDLPPETQIDWQDKYLTENPNSWELFSDNTHREALAVDKVRGALRSSLKQLSRNIYLSEPDQFWMLTDSNVRANATFVLSQMAQVRKDTEIKLAIFESMRTVFSRFEQFSPQNMPSMDKTTSYRELLGLLLMVDEDHFLEFVDRAVKLGIVQERRNVNAR